LHREPFFEKLHLIFFGEQTNGDFFENFTPAFSKKSQAEKPV